MSWRGVRPWGIVSVGGVAILVALRSILYGDLSFYDETSYLTRGLAQGSGGWATFTDGAVYSDFYLLLSKLIKSPVNLYFAGRALAAVALVLGTWLSVRILTRPWIAFVAAVMVALSSLPYTWPSVSAPAIALLMVAMSMVFRWRTSWVFGVASGLVWLAAGCRPEYVWAATAFSIICLSWVIWDFSQGELRTQKNLLKAIVALLSAFMLPAVLFIVHGLPYSNNGRDWDAFSQHFSLRRASGSEDPWLDAGAIVSRSFPDAHSVLDAFRASPGNFAQHVIANFLDVPKASIQAFIQLPPTSWSILVLLGFLSLLIGTLAAIYLVAKEKSENTHALQRSCWLRLNWRAFVVLGILVATIAVQNLVIYPRPHYLIAPILLLLVLACLILDRLNKGSRVEQGMSLAFAIILLAAGGLVTIRALEISSGSAPLASVARVLSQLTPPVRLLAVDWGLSTYVQELEQISVGPKPGESFESFLNRERIDAVMINERFKGAIWSQASGFQQFVNDPAATGFSQVHEGSDFWIRTRAGSN